MDEKLQQLLLELKSWIRRNPVPACLVGLCCAPAAVGGLFATLLLLPVLLPLVASAAAALVRSTTLLPCQQSKFAMKAYFASCLTFAGKGCWPRWLCAVAQQSCFADSISLSATAQTSLSEDRVPPWQWKSRSALDAVRLSFQHWSAYFPSLLWLGVEGSYAYARLQDGT